MSARISGELAGGGECVAFIGKNGVRLERDRTVQMLDNMARQRPALPNPLFVYLSNGGVVTLWGAYVERSFSNLSKTHERIRGRVAFVGPDEFGHGRLVDEARVVPSNQKVAIFYRGHRSMRQAADETVPLPVVFATRASGARYAFDIFDNQELIAVDAETENLRTRLGVALTMSSSTQGSRYREERYGRLTYSSAVSFEHAWQDVYSLCEFFSMTVGEVIAPAKVRLISGQADENGMRPAFEVYFRRPRRGKKVPPRHAYRALSSPAHSSRGYAESLRCWMARREVWRQSNTLMSETLLRQREVSRDRFLTASAWFESIADFYVQPAQRLATASINKAADAAHGELQSEEGAPTLDRLRQVLGSLNNLPLGRRIGDALQHLRGRFPAGQLPDAYNELSRSIARIRGRFAHGEDAFLGPDGPRVFAATLLLETICYLLTASDLQLENIAPAFGHPLNVALMELPNRVAESGTGDRP